MISMNLLILIVILILELSRIAKEHAVIVNKSGRVVLRPKDGLVLHNGSELTEEVELQHQDR